MARICVVELTGRNEPVPLTSPTQEDTMTPDDRPNVVLVHGAWADGSCWSAVIQALQAEGYNVIAPQFPKTSLAHLIVDDQGFGWPGEEDFVNHFAADV